MYSKQIFRCFGNLYMICLFALQITSKLQFFQFWLFLYYDKLRNMFYHYSRCTLYIYQRCLANEGHVETHHRDVMHSSELVCHTWMFVKCTIQSLYPEHVKVQIYHCETAYDTREPLTGSCILDLYRKKSSSNMYTYIYAHAHTDTRTYNAPYKHISQTQSRNCYPIPLKKMPTTTASSRFEQENAIHLDIDEKWCKLIYELNQCLFRKFFRYCKNRKTRSTGSKRDALFFFFFLLHLQWVSCTHFSVTLFHNFLTIYI